MKKLFLIFTSLSILIGAACKKEKEGSITGYVYVMQLDLEFLDQNGVSLFSNNQLKPERYNIDVTYIIDGKPVDFYSLRETAEHQYVAFLYNDDYYGKKVIRVNLNNYLTENKSTTIIKIKGYPADTLYSEFFVDKTSAILKKCTINHGQSYDPGEVVTLVK